MHDGDTVEIVLLSADITGPALSEIGAVLTTAETDRAHHFHFEADRRRWIVGRASLRYLLSRRLGIPPQSLQFGCGTHGKPFLPASRLHFNLSHSGNVVAIALAASDVGIDVEERHDIPDMHQVASRFFSPLELAGINAATDPIGVFFRIWTMKEAVVKALGGGLSLPLEHFTVWFADSKTLPTGVLAASPIIAGFSAAGLYVREGYYGAVARRGQGWRLAVHWENVLDLVP
ncbi:MAG TPA: 4'-phosphopantetheinyl transferase superfamily protein [Rhizomicrobium sp.]